MILSLSCSKKTSLQTRATYKVENTKCILYVTIGVGHYKEKVD